MGSCEERGLFEGSWKGAAVQRVLVPRSRIIAIVRSHYQATTSEDRGLEKTVIL
jgi:hypothetical protein